MGKPYASELAVLSDTYAWAMQVDVGELVDSVASTTRLPLIAAGSGGSLTAANYAALLHEELTGTLAREATPLEIVSSTTLCKDAAVLFLSAGGRNTDIVSAFKHVVVREPQRLAVLCFDSSSPLAELASGFRTVDLVCYDLPSGRDGFLAANSLLAFMILLNRAYSLAFFEEDALPTSLEALAYGGRTATEFTTQMREKCRFLWQRDSLVVLYDVATRSAAIDLESKFTEAALGSVQIADYRNFAHGRHHWLAKKSTSTAILAFSSRRNRNLADETLRLIPSSVPVVTIDAELDGPAAGVLALVRALHLVGLAGEARRIDPGRPGVPGFGRRIYNLRAMPNTDRVVPPSFSKQVLASIERKAGTTTELLSRRGELKFWRNAYSAFVLRLTHQSFPSVAFDYDGTLCDRHDRFTGLADAVVKELVRLLDGGILVGIATGRGKSVKQDLRAKIPPVLWSQLVVGYYNGADIAFLSDDSHPFSGEDVCDELRDVKRALESNWRLGQLSQLTYRRRQITVEPSTPVAGEVVWDVIQQIVNSFAAPCVRALRSSHSIDILGPNVSKQALVARLEELDGSSQPSPVLCVGDKGRWPGNDFELLAGPYSLSVDEVSPDPMACWNLAPAGHRGVQATTYYLDRIRGDGVRSVRFRFSR